MLTVWDVWESLMLWAREGNIASDVWESVASRWGSVLRTTQRESRDCCIFIFWLIDRIMEVIILRWQKPSGKAVVVDYVFISTQNGLKTPVSSYYSLLVEFVNVKCRLFHFLTGMHCCAYMHCKHFSRTNTKEVCEMFIAITYLLNTQSDGLLIATGDFNMQILSYCSLNSICM